MSHGFGIRLGQLDYIGYVYFGEISDATDKIPNLKHQISNNFQKTIYKSQTKANTSIDVVVFSNPFVCLEFGISVIVIYLEFVFYVLEFPILTSIAYFRG